MYPNESNELGGVKNNKERMTQAFEAGVRIVKQGSTPNERGKK